MHQPTIEHETILARDISFEDYLAHFNGEFCEWVNGVVIKMSPINRAHDELSQFLLDLFRALVERIGGAVVGAPMVMRLSELARGREPDIQVLLPGNEWRVGATFVEGPADLVIEIVSPESVERDRGEKFTEYERGGVKEYWLFDPQRREHLFYVLGEDGLYSPRYPDADGIYRSPVFPKLALPVALLWQQPLPGIRQIIALVDTMLEVGS